MTDKPKIPIQNIYYLLCYAWNKLEEKDIVDVSGIDSTELLDLFAKVLIGGLRHLFKRGLDRGYVPYSEDTRCIRGKIDFNSSIKTNLINKGQLHCHHDEFSFNVLHNQILKATIRSLIHAQFLDNEHRQHLIGFYRKLREIDLIRLNSQCFSRVQLHRNNSFYDFLLKICELIYDYMLPTEEPGKSKFRDFLQDERKMALLFEEFVRNFYKIEASGYQVGRDDILWDATPLADNAVSLLPKMQTDISIETEGSKLIIDTKFYKEALTSHFDREKARSAHLYQIYAYLRNIESKGGLNTECSGMLLYPTVQDDFSEGYMMDSHKVMIQTVNLNQDWGKIHQDLLGILIDGLQSD